MMIENKLLEIILELRREIRLTDQRVRQLATGGGGGGGDMYKSVYDTDSDNIVDNSEKIDGRKIYVSDSPPGAGDGEDGDIWIEY